MLKAEAEKFKMSRKVLKHPDKEEIITLLTNGASVRELEAKYKEKYKNSKHLWLSSVTLQSFRKNYLKLEGKVLKDIQETGRVQQQVVEEQSRQKQLQSSDAYNKKLNEIVDSKLDVARKILQLDKVIETRMEYWFNAVASGEETASKGDKELRQFMDRQMMLLGQYKKFVEGMADKTVDYNVNITVMNDQISLIRDSIRDCIAEMNPEQGMMFMEKLNRRMNSLSYRPNNELPPAIIRLEELQEIQEAEIEPTAIETENPDDADK
jgi:hypothetical protein